MTSLEGIRLAFEVAQTREAAVDIAALVSAHSALLFRVAFSILRSRAEAEDVVQDVFVRVLQHEKSLTDVRDMRVWLTRIAWNLALDRQRRQRPEQMNDVFLASLAVSDVPADKRMQHDQNMRAVLSEMRRLPKSERQALLLSALEELTITEIAAIMGKSESGVRALLFRARTRLRERLGKGHERS